MAIPRLLHTSLSDDPRVAFVDVEVLSNILPQFFEDGSTPGEVEPSKERVRNCLSNNFRGRTRYKLNYTRRDSGLLQQLVYNIVRVCRRG